MRDIVARAFEQATAILRVRRADLDKGGRLLLTQETLTADQFPAIQPAQSSPKWWGDLRLDLVPVKIAAISYRSSEGGLAIRRQRNYVNKIRG